MILNTFLQEQKIEREKFNKALEIHRNDGEILELLDINYDSYTGVEITEEIIEEILVFEIKEISKDKSLKKKYILEDEIWENWGVELSDVHYLAESSKKLKVLYQQLRKTG